MISRTLFRPARLAVLGAVVCSLVPFASADIVTGLSTSATANATVYNNGSTLVQGPASSQSQQVLSDPSVTTLSASADSATGWVSLSQNVLADTNGDVQQITWQAAANGNAWATAEYGALHASATGVEEELPGTLTYMYYDDSGSPQAVTVTTPLTAQGGASAEARYTDKFTVTSTTLSFGTAIDALFTFTLDGSTNVPGPWPAVTADYDLEPNNPFNSPTSLAQLWMTSSGSLTTVTVSQRLYVGEVFGISGVLTASAGTPQNCTPPVCDQQTLNADAGNTSKMFIDLQTDGASLDSYSGHDYSTPTSVPTSTPEPSTLSFLASGIGGLAVLRRKGRR